MDTFQNYKLSRTDFTDTITAMVGEGSITAVQADELIRLAMSMSMSAIDDVMESMTQHQHRFLKTLNQKPQS